MKFRRKAEPTQEPAAATDGDPTPVDAPTEGGSTPPSTQTGSGPFDESEVAGDGVERVDLGSLLVRPTPGRELRLQVDEPTGTVQAVMLAGPDGALEFQAFAAPRNGDLWSTVRPQIAADIARRGGTTTEREGRFGTELLCQVPVQRPDGTAATQPSRIIGINGERWMLRASLLGRPAVEPDSSGEWEDALAQVVVRRGSEAMPVGEPLTVVLPEQARRVN
ncbi:DUF3710 domain-containing protein [Nocardioides sediminis]|uniref:DUF3710 domain-containing protein n=1 Tax=Nocardioides sediminis TaxID=433648 RepID=UPI001F3EEA3D|nr:DUF3710 domain-containing protein [Nocardioides sediminis]